MSMIPWHGHNWDTIWIQQGWRFYTENQSLKTQDLYLTWSPIKSSDLSLGHSRFEFHNSTSCQAKSSQPEIPLSFWPFKHAHIWSSGTARMFYLLCCPRLELLSAFQMLTNFHLFSTSGKWMISVLKTRFNCCQVTSTENIYSEIKSRKKKKRLGPYMWLPFKG